VVDVSAGTSSLGGMATSRPRHVMKLSRFTETQSRYLAFLHAYSRGRSISESTRTACR